MALLISFISFSMMGWGVLLFITADTVTVQIVGAVIGCLGVINFSLAAIVERLTDLKKLNR